MKFRDLERGTEREVAPFGSVVGIACDEVALSLRDIEKMIAAPPYRMHSWLRERVLTRFHPDGRGEGRG